VRDSVAAIKDFLVWVEIENKHDERIAMSHVNDLNWGLGNAYLGRIAARKEAVEKLGELLRNDGGK